MAGKALEGVKVLEFASFVAGPYCSKLLADLGAQVIKIEEPGAGDETRRRGPFLDDIPHHEKSGLFLYLNTNKLGITLDPKTKTGKKIFHELVRWADILIEDNPPRVMEELGLTYETLKAINPKLVMTSITPYGQTGPYRDYKAYYLNTFHAGGEATILSARAPERKPIKAGGYLGEYDTGLSAAMATMGALYFQGAAGIGQHVDISKQEAAIASERVENAIYPNRHKEETISIASATAQTVRMVGGLTPCKDGYVIMAAAQDQQWKGLMKMMGNPDWSKEERFKDEQGRAENAGELNAHLLEWAKDRTCEEIYHAGQASNCPMGIVYSTKNLFESPHLNAREFFVEIDHPEAGRIKYPGSAYRLSETPTSWERPAPLLGEHNDEVYTGLLSYSKDDLVRMKQAGVI